MQELLQYSKPFDEGKVILMKKVVKKKPNPLAKLSLLHCLLFIILVPFLFFCIIKRECCVGVGVGVGVSTTMGTKIKGIKKGIKYISQIFVVKEQEMEIGYPTDVKHVAHIGWDSQNSNAPSWMNEFKTTSDFSSSNIGGPSWSSQDFEQSLGRQQASEVCNENPQPTDAPKVPKKKKLKKIKSAFSPKSGSSSRSSKALKSKTSFATALNEMERQPNLHGLTS